LEKNQLFRQFWGVRNGILMRVKHGNLREVKEYYRLLVKSCFFSFKGCHFKELLNLKKAILFGTLNSIYYLNCIFKNKKRSSFESFNGFEYAKLMNKYDQKK
jgi:hypothetical protein